MSAYRSFICKLYAEKQIGFNKLVRLLETTVDGAKEELRKRNILVRLDDAE